MRSNKILALCFTLLLLNAVAAHNHGSANNLEREEDGGYLHHNHHHHYDEEDEHDVNFDHEAILGSSRVAEEYDQLSPEEAKQRLALLLTKMDADRDGQIAKAELKQWILSSFQKLSEEESAEKFQESDSNGDGEITWDEYIAENYGIQSEEDADILAGRESSDELKMYRNDKEIFENADLNKNGKLDRKEFLGFSHPEEVDYMIETILRQTMDEKDVNKDGLIDFVEYMGDRMSNADISKQREMFDQDYDLNGDGVLDALEFRAWVAPDNNEIAEDEVEHLFNSADDNADSVLSFKEILDHHDVFVGSEATDYGDHLNNLHRFQDEL